MIYTRLKVELETNHTTANPDEMMSMLNSLSVSGGADCPEYSISGLITGTKFGDQTINLTFRYIFKTKIQWYRE